MPQCIYSKKFLEDSKFSKQEHVIPACIGGIHKLPINYVSDEVNEMFSPLELAFARSSIISIPRAILGPGKRGSLSIKKATVSQISIIESSFDGQMHLGFVKKGTPYIINQVHFRNDSDIEPKRFFSFSCEAIIGKSESELLMVFWKQLETYRNDATVIKHCSIQENEFILGIFENKWYLGISKECEDAEALAFFSEAIKNIIAAKDHGILEIGEAQRSGSLVTIHSQLVFNIFDYYRVFAKIAFNTLAYIKGANFVLNDIFNPVRNAIYTGNDIEKYVSHSSNDEFLSQILIAQHASEFGRFSHLVTVSHIGSSLVSTISLYGLNAPMLVNLTDKIGGIEMMLDGLFCDWENRREISLLEFVHSISRNGISE